MSLVGLYLLFIKFGLLCIGGGYVLVPILFHDLVDVRAILDGELFGKLVAIAQMTPGPIGINIATFCGFKTQGVVGAVVATAGLLTPAMILVPLAVFYYRRFEKTLVVRGLFAGMRPATLGLIFAAIAIFLQLSVLTEPLPLDWVRNFLGIKDVTPSEPAFGINIGALVLMLTAAVVLWRTKISVFYLIFGAALLGAFIG